MTKKYASGRFCCKACANSRERSEEIKNKIRATYIKTLLTKPQPEEHVVHSKCFCGYYKGIYCSSSYELIFLLYCEKHNIKVERCKITFTYNYKHKN